MKIVLESKDSIDKTVYAEVTEEGMKDFLVWFVAFRHAAQQGVHLTAFGVSTQAIRVSTFMPRWASRITLEIMNIRVERVQEITRNDAKAEGANAVWYWDAFKKTDLHKRGVLNPYIANFSVLWDAINANSGFGWDVNPWVWVVDFKAVV